MPEILQTIFQDPRMWPVPPDYRLLIPAIGISFIALEYMIARLAGRHVHDAGESAASIGVWLGSILVRALEIGLLAVPFAIVYEHRLFDIPMNSVWALLGLFFGTELSFYLLHVGFHNIRWMWATHAVHHTSTRFNLTAGVRLGWTGMLSGNFLFLLPLVWIGFHPLAVQGMLAASLFYQFFVHTDLIRNLGPLEWVLNTPRHHQVHHCSDPRYGNKNYGGVLIIYDRLFGTFAERPAGELQYGLAQPVKSNNPVWIALHEWVRMALDVWHAPDWRNRWRAVAGRP